jgi:hypothetical protein
VTSAIAADITVVQLGGWIAGILGFLILLAGAFEKAFTPAAKFVQRVVTDPVVEKIDVMATYVGHHLGPNGNTTPLHKRVEGISQHQREDRRAIEELQRAVDDLAERQKRDITAMALTEMAREIPLHDREAG